MGEVRLRVTLRNFVDVALAERGSGRLEDVPASRLDCLVDPGADMVLLPEDGVGKLGLSRGGRVIVTSANDRREELPTARALEVSLPGRSMVTDCVIGPPLCEPLIGQLALEELDLVVGCARNTLGPRPESPNVPLWKLKQLASP
jgi:predicted aspartyl protease